MSLLNNSSEPGRIHRLDPLVVNRIAAGEVIQRPSNALKELLENALDAGSTSISVTVKGGGLTSLSIQDNGCGIPVSDFPMLAERFATSKLEKFEDLRSIETFGFRGEALASISMVSRMTVVSMTKDSPCAWKATYSDGKMLGKPRPTAGVQGTTITVENMFYNVPARRAAFSRGGGPQDEYNRILDVVNRYAVLYSENSVAFSVRKAGSVTADVSIHCNNSLDALGAVFGGTIKKELIEFKAESGPDPKDSTNEAVSDVSASDLASDAMVTNDDETKELEKDVLTFTCTGWISSGTYHSLVTSFSGNAPTSHASRRRGAFILFINNRLVEHSALRRALEAIYQTILPRGAKPFIYLNIRMPPSHLDVNVHPTKREVAFLHQEQLIVTMQEHLSQALEGVNKSRVFFTQSLLPLPSALLPGNDDPSTAPATDTSRLSSSCTQSPVTEPQAEGSRPGIDPGHTPPRGQDCAAAQGAPSERLTSVGSVLSQYLREDYNTRNKPTPATVATSEVPSPGAKMSNRSASGSAVQANKKVRVDHSDYRGMERFVQRRKREADRPAGAVPGATSTDTTNTTTTATASAIACDEGGVMTTSQAMDASDNVQPNTPERDKNTSISTPGTMTRSHMREISQWQPVYLTSVHALCNDILRRQHRGLQKVLERGVFVGLLDNDLSLIQSDTNLLLLHHVQCMRELFYQQSLALFSNMNTFPLTDPLPIQHNILHVLHSNGIGVSEEGGAKGMATPFDASAIDKDSVSGSIGDSDGDGDDTRKKRKTESVQSSEVSSTPSASPPPAPGPTPMENDTTNTAKDKDKGNAQNQTIHVHMIAAMVVKLLESKAALLREYFGVDLQRRSYCTSSSAPGTSFVANCKTCGHSVLNTAVLKENQPFLLPKPTPPASSPAVPPAPGTPSDKPSCTVEEHLSVIALPRLITNHTPYLPILPAFLVHLAFGVDWNDELLCFHTIAQALGVFYSVLPPIPLEIGIGQGLLPPQPGVEAATRVEVEAYRVHPQSPYVLMETVIFPALKNPKLFTAPRKISENGFIVRLASTERLYRIFERC